MFKESYPIVKNGKHLMQYEELNFRDGLISREFQNFVIKIFTNHFYRGASPMFVIRLIVDTQKFMHFHPNYHITVLSVIMKF